ncbi:MAG: zeta toxin family protein [Gemmataceae bacterium]
MDRDKKIVIIAGPNGAGKTTFAREFLPREASCLAFLNADLIAAGLSPFSPDTEAIRAGRLMLQTIKDKVALGVSFAFETTLSGLIYSRLISAWQSQGYQIKLVFLELPDVQMAIDRVASRVGQGGYNIPVDIIRRRFVAGLNHFQTIYKPIVDVWLHFDNAGFEPRLLDWSER